MEHTRPFLDFKAIKARIRIADVLARYQVTLNRANQTSLKGDCPLPSHGSKSRNTFFANETKQVWYCHSASCQKDGRRAGGNAIDLVALMENLSPYEAARRIDEWFPASGSPAIKATAPEPQPDVGNGGNRPLAFRLKDICPEHPMIQSRAISIQTARLFGIGAFPGKGSMRDRIVFELHEQGALVGYAGRATLPEQEPKWLVGKGLVKSFLYGVERCDPAKPLIVCESFWGPPFFFEKGWQAASLMGSEMTEAQERCLDPYPTITVALDNDAAGDEKAARIVERLRRKHRVLKARVVG